MKKVFYNKLDKVLKNSKEVFLVTIVDGEYNGKNVVGEKAFKTNDELVIEDIELTELWSNVFDNIDKEKGTHVAKVDGVEVFVEWILGKPKLVICGGGHISLELCKIAKMLEFEVTVIDNREDFANTERFSMADKVICDEYDNVFREMEFTKNTYFVIVTKGHKDDRNCLENIVKNNNDFAYVGMIGSKVKSTFVFKAMIEAGYERSVLDKVHTPVGLEIGAETPTEVAISILAEIVKVKNQRPISEIEDKILEELHNEGTKVLATIIEKKGSVPRGATAKMLMKEDESFLGTVGGGKVENVVYYKALELIKKDENIVETYDLSNPDKSELGMACGGIIKVVFEVVK